MCEEAIATAAEAVLRGGDEALKKKAAELEEGTDRQEREIESLCMTAASSGSGTATQICG